METLSTLNSIFAPRSVAVIGASSAPGKLGHDILANLKNGGFPGPLYPINPRPKKSWALRSISPSRTPPRPRTWR